MFSLQNRALWFMSRRSFEIVCCLKLFNRVVSINNQDSQNFFLLLALFCKLVSDIQIFQQVKIFQQELHLKNIFKYITVLKLIKAGNKNGLTFLCVLVVLL